MKKIIFHIVLRFLFLFFFHYFKLIVLIKILMKNVLESFLDGVSFKSHNNDNNKSNFLKQLKMKKKNME